MLKSLSKKISKIKIINQLIITIDVFITQDLVLDTLYRVAFFCQGGGETAFDILILQFDNDKRSPLHAGFHADSSSRNRKRGKLFESYGY